MDTSQGAAAPGEYLVSNYYQFASMPALEYSNVFTILSYEINSTS